MKKFYEGKQGVNEEQRFYKEVYEMKLRSLKNNVCIKKLRSYLYKKQRSVKKTTFLYKSRDL